MCYYGSVKCLPWYIMYITDDVDLNHLLFADMHGSQEPLIGNPANGNSLHYPSDHGDGDSVTESHYYTNRQQPHVVENGARPPMSPPISIEGSQIPGVPGER